MNDPFDAAAQEHASAREWHKLQLGVLGFVGLCGVLRGDPARGARCGCRTSAESPRSPAWCKHAGVDAGVSRWRRHP